MKFTGKVVLITGASSGIGAAAARHLANLGAHVAIVGRNADRVHEVSNEIKQAGLPTPLPIVADVTKDAERIINETVEKFGKLDVLVNNAGIIRFSPFAYLDMSTFDEIQSTNIRSAVLLSKLAIPHLEKTKGNIVNVSSIGGIHPLDTASAYCMSKAALNMLTQCLALELGPKGIRVNAINAGLIVTPSWPMAEISADQAESILAMCIRETPIGRVGSVPDTSSAIAYLASDQSSFITGVLLKVDGGRTMTGMS